MYFIALRLGEATMGTDVEDGSCCVQFKMRNTSKDSIIFQTRKKVKPLVETEK